MKSKTFLIVLAAALSLCREARCDLYFQQDVHAEHRGLEESQDGSGNEDFRRKIYVVGQLLAFQIEEKGKLRKEYGFDFAKDLYYEAEPGSGYYKKFDLKLLGEAFDKMAREVRSYPTGRTGRQQVAAEFARAMMEGEMNYPVRLRKAFFGKQRFSGQSARLYKLRAGPGTSFLNFFGWYRKADVWASNGLPGFSEYTVLRARLARKAAFYKIKHNRISDLITTLAALEAIPLRIDSTARRRFERATALETTREVTSALSTAKIQPSRLLYFKEGARFSWNVVFSKGTEFGPEVALERGESFSWRRSLPWMIVPVFFLLCAFAWFLGPYQEKERLSLQKMLVFHTYLLSALLFGLQVLHYLADIPYLFSPVWELAATAAAGAALILWQGWAHWSAIGRQMREERLRYCPHCHARCEEFYVVCPKCNRAIMPAQSHGSTIPPE